MREVSGGGCEKSVGCVEEGERMFCVELKLFFDIIIFFFLLFCSLFFGMFVFIQRKESVLFFEMSSLSFEKRVFFLLKREFSFF
jgi:hypothetical protein